MNQTQWQQDVPQKQTWWWRCSGSSALAWPRRRTGTSDWPSRCWLRSPPPAVWRCEGDVFSSHPIRRQQQLHISVERLPSSLMNDSVRKVKPCCLTRAMWANTSSVRVDVVSEASPAGCSACSGLWSSCSSWSRFGWLDLSSVNGERRAVFFTGRFFLGSETPLPPPTKRKAAVYL